MDYIKETVNSSTVNVNSLLDNYEELTSFDGYLPPILKTRVEFRRGNPMKILSVLMQIYEISADNEDEAKSLLPPKDCFYYSMLSSVYYSSGLYSQAKHAIHMSIKLAEEEKADAIIFGYLLNNLASTCLYLHQKDEALEAIKQAIHFLPENQSFWFRYGELCYTIAMDYQQQQAQAQPPFSLLRNQLVTTQSSSSLLFQQQSCLEYLK